MGEVGGRRGIGNELSIFHYRVYDERKKSGLNLTTDIHDRILCSGLSNEKCYLFNLNLIILVIGRSNSQDILNKNKIILTNKTKPLKRQW